MERIEVMRGGNMSQDDENAYFLGKIQKAIYSFYSVMGVRYEIY
jgi:hypothetical protein